MFYHTALPLLIVLLAPTAFGQQPALRDDADRSSVKRAADGAGAASREEPATNLEKMLVRRDVLLIKEFFNIGIVPGQQGTEIRIEALAVGVANEPTRRFGLSFIRPAGRGVGADKSGNRDYLCLVDFDELLALQNALDTIVKTVNSRQAADAESPSRPSTKPDESATSDDSTGPFQEFSILTRSGMKIGMIQIGRQHTGFVQMNYQASDSGILFGIGALSRLRNLLAQARVKLAGLGAK